VKRAPKVAQFLKQVNFDIPTLNDWILKVGDKEDPYEVAKKWVAANSKVVNGWLAGIK
jgi:ABC-type proline/glycine betaine transport system substrate-binding protein